MNNDTTQNPANTSNAIGETLMELQIEAARVNPAYLERLFDGLRHVSRTRDLGTTGPRALQFRNVRGQVVFARWS